MSVLWCSRPVSPLWGPVFGYSLSSCSGSAGFLGAHEVSERRPGRSEAVLQMEAVA